MVQIIFDSSYLLRPATFLEDVKGSPFINHSNISRPSLEVVYLFLLQKVLQSSILSSIVCRFYSYHFLSLAIIHCHLLPLAVIFCHSLYHSLVFVVTRCHSLSLVIPLVVNPCYLLSLVATRCTSRLSFYKLSGKTIEIY